MNLTNHDKAQIEKIKPNTKIRILSEEHRKYVSKLFEIVNPREIKIFEHVKHLHFKSEGSSQIIWTHSEKETYFTSDNQKEIFIDLPPKESKIADLSLSSQNKIKPPFKFRNANLPVVRQWLKDNGYQFENKILDIMNANLHHEFGIVNRDGFFITLIGESHFINLKHFELEDYPELTFNIETKITSVSIDNTAEIAKLESELESLSGKVNEIQAKLSNLKS